MLVTNINGQAHFGRLRNAHFTISNINDTLKTIPITVPSLSKLIRLEFSKFFFQWCTLTYAVNCMALLLNSIRNPSVSKFKSNLNKLNVYGNDYNIIYVVNYIKCTIYHYNCLCKETTDWIILCLLLNGCINTLKVPIIETLIYSFFSIYLFNSLINILLLYNNYTHFRELM